jgi:hypothetical protein
MVNGTSDWGGRFVEAGQGFLAFFLAPVHWGGCCLRRFLETLLRGVDFTWLLSHEGRCGQANLPPAPSYGLQSSNEGTRLSIKRCLVPSCYSEWWCLSRGCEASRLGYLMDGWPSGYLCYRIFIWSRLFLSWYAYPMSESSSHLCVYPWSSYCTRRWWDGFHHLSTWYQVRVGSCNHVPSCQVPQVNASWGLMAGSAYPLLKAPRRAWSEAQALPWVKEGGGSDRQVVKSCPFVPTVGWKSGGTACSWG